MIARRVIEYFIICFSLNSKITKYLSEQSHTYYRLGNIRSKLRDIEPILADTGINAIAQSFPANVTQFIEFTLKDCSILKIYESFEFDSSAPSYIVGNVYRISSADYDFLKNEVFIRAYQI